MTEELRSRRATAPETRAVLGVLAVMRNLPGAQLRELAYRRVARRLRRRLRGSAIVRTVDGVRVRVDLGDIAGGMLATSGVWEPNMTAAFRSLVRPGDVVVDAGANVGYFSLLASRLAGPTGTVYALEPATPSYEELCGNVLLNDATNVRPCHVAAGHRNDLLPLFVPPGGNSGRASLVEWPGANAFGGETVTVPVSPLADIVAEEHRLRVAVVKIDVEGYEESVLRGLEPLLERGARPAVLLEGHGPFLEQLTPYLSGFCERFGLTAYELLDVRGERVSVSRKPLRELITPVVLADLRNGTNTSFALLPPERSRASAPASRTAGLAE